MNDWIYIGIYLFGIVVASISQIMLKKSTAKKYDKLWQEYLNLRVILIYGLFFLSMLMTMLAYKKVPLSMGPILSATEYIFVAVMGYLLLKEKIGKRKLMGLMLIISGIVVYSLDF